MGCALQTFRGEPDILIFPDLPDTVTPGGDVELSIQVDEDTRLVKATLMHAWRLRPPASSARPTETVIENTLGNEVIELIIMTDPGISGLYYADITLCGRSCEESEVVYTLNRANAGEGSDAINDPYERIAFQNATEIRSTFTCRHPDTVAFQ